jgi:uncharacterized protein (DUF2235 family)
MPKNIVIFSDGTGQEGGKGFKTNIYKLFNMIEDRTENQISFYDRGLGTGWRKITGNISGMGISKNIYECYEFLFNNYMAEDNIFLFGFSRGATTVRSLSAFIHLFGILPKSRPELIKQAYRIYKISDKDERKQKADEFISRHHNQWCKVKFLGVWDTVDALGIPFFNKINFIIDWIPFFKHKFHNLQLSESVEHARQALAIDDERLTFHPKIWDKEIKDYQTMRQVWFCGMHTDVGGGYKEQQLSDITLLWMTIEAMKHGLKLYEKHQVTLNPDPDGLMHNSRKGFPGILFRKKIRSWKTETHGNPVVHESVRMRKLNVENNDSSPYKPWILDESKYNYEVDNWAESFRNLKRIPHDIKLNPEHTLHE